VVKLYRHNPYIRLGGDIATIIGILAFVSVGVAGGMLWWANGIWPSQISLRALGTSGVFAVILLQNSTFVAWSWWRIADNQRERLGVTITDWPRVVIYSIIGVPLVLASNIVVGVVFVLLGLRQNQTAGYPLIAGDYVGQLVFLIAAAVIAPLGEELLFRGYFWERLRQLGGVYGAIIGSALIFAVGHSLSASQGAIVLVMQTFVMGIVLAWLRHASGSIWAGWVAHSVNNMIAVAVTIYVINHPQTNGIDNSIAVAIVTYCINHPLFGCVRAS
jgi:membrane protease YdiL (CAAX protease family)